ncbi:hypothetical protein FA95DRAFT_1558381 [Auriscalpium vulgare]|uniref:Uncharacterized protein n=1 Tax=Auriscalpium vulgare TaxID=40419 RepID=A0ACB8RV57_9AGAM|nr:hypothetical protein FA95DRAFT_1558381 [Auriscalpium vulgare]
MIALFKWLRWSSPYNSLRQYVTGIITRCARAAPYKIPASNDCSNCVSLPTHRQFKMPNNFTSMVELHAYMDKTGDFQHILKEIGRSMSGPVHVILRPRRTGKSTFLRSLAEFMKKTSPGDAMVRRRTFEKYELAISRDEELFERHFGAHIVLYLDLTNVVGLDLAGLQASFVQAVLNGVQDMKESGCFNGNHDELEPEDIYFLKQIRKVSQRADATSPLDPINILKQVIRVANRLSKRCVFLIIDEYDTPIAVAMDKGYYAEANYFLRQALGDVLKNEPAVSGAMLAGIMDLAQAGWMSGLNQMTAFTLESPEYEIMFTEGDVETLFYMANHPKPTEHTPLPFTFDKLKAWYGGYDSASGRKLYNPWSVTNALSKKRLGSFWEKTGVDIRAQDLMQNMLDEDADFGADIDGLLADGHITCHLPRNLKADCDLANMTRPQLLRLMVYTGYLNAVPFDSAKTPSVQLSNGGYDDDDDEDTNVLAVNWHQLQIRGVPEANTEATKLTIPNQEVRGVFIDWLKLNMARKLDTPERISESQDLFEITHSADLETFANSFSIWIEQKLPTNFISEVECVYQAYIFGYFAAAAAHRENPREWSVTIEQAAGQGRLDLLIQNSTHAVVHEYKRLEPKKEYKDKNGTIKRIIRDYKNPKTETLLERLSIKALNQTENRRYRVTIGEGVTELREVGIAFLRRNTAIVSRLLERPDKDTEWRVKEEYTVEQDRIRRKRMYHNVATIPEPWIRKSWEP